MNVALLPPEKSVESLRDMNGVHAANSNAPDAKAVAALLEAAENEEQKRRSIIRTRNTVLGTLYSVVLAALGGLCIALALSHIEPHSQRTITLVCAVVNPLIWAFGLVFEKFVNARAPIRKNTAAALLQLSGEPRSLLPLIDALHVAQMPEWKTLLFPFLTERLWSLPATDAALSLDETRRATLRNTLSHVYAIMPNGKRQVRTPGTFDDVTADLGVAIMKTLAGMGDKKTVKVLQKIIKAEATTPNETVVRDAAREYLPVLVQKIAENDETQKQLRQRAGEKIRDPQKVVEEFVDTLPAEEAKVALVQFLQAENEGKVTCAGIAAALGLFACLLPFLGLQNVALLLFITIGFVSPSICALLVVANSKWSDADRIIAGELAKRSETDTRLLAVLLHAAQYTKNTKQADTLKKAFVRLLPLLQPGDAARVPPAERVYLRSWLKTPLFKRPTKASQTLTVAALDALAALGDTKSLPAAQKIARRTLHSTYRETELHEAAVRCVDGLRARR